MNRDALHLPRQALTLRSWDEMTSGAFALLMAGSVSEAAIALRDANAAAANWPTDDPRHATAANNNGLACLLVGDFETAARLFTQAGQLWSGLYSAISEMEIPIAGRASVFHLMLASKHADAMTKIRKGRLRDLHAAAAAISSVNLLVAERRLSDPTPSGGVLDDAIDKIRRAFGETASEIKELRILKAKLSGAEPLLTGPKHEGGRLWAKPITARWPSVANAAWPPHRDLLAAIHLNALATSIVRAYPDDTYRHPTNRRD